MSENKKKEAKKGALQSPKGMRDLIGKDFYSYQGFFEKSSEIAEYYGFKPIDTPMLEDTAVFTSGIGQSTDIVEKEMYEIKSKSGGSSLSMRPEGTAGIMRSYIENGMQSLPQPLSFYYFGPFFRHEKPQRGRLRELRQFGLEMMGSEKSVADAMIIKIATTMLAEAGLENVVVHVNSIGDKSCRGFYRKDLVSYYKKHSNEICKDCKNRMKTNPLRLLDCKDPKCQKIKENAPSTVSFLCDACKQHFKEVLEYLEMLKIEYVIDNNLVRGLDYYTRTVFEFVIKGDNTEEKIAPVEGEVITEKTEAVEEDTSSAIVVGGGGRYDYLAKALGSRKDVPGVGMAIGVDRVVMAKNFVPIIPKTVKKPKFYFIQLGFSAKLHSLAVIEILRKAKVGVMHSLNKDSLSAQLSSAEKIGVPYSIILGQKEVLDGTVIVRNMDNRSQEEIKVEKLSDYVKKLK